MERAKLELGMGCWDGRCNVKKGGKTEMSMKFGDGGLKEYVK